MKEKNIAEVILGKIKVNGCDATIVRLEPTDGMAALALRIAGEPSEGLSGVLKDCRASSETPAGWRFVPEESATDILAALAAEGLVYETWCAEYNPTDGVVLALREELAA